MSLFQPFTGIKHSELTIGTFKARSYSRVSVNPLDVESMISTARPATLNVQLQYSDWFRNRLRRATEDPNCQTADASEPQLFAKKRPTKIAISVRYPRSSGPQY
ncbi:hypothetical protein AX15_000494 [Amanita polypyramis BW_CC]|nr:hypothetical protein AX15_000494 [Amanita polypyramis BW_CC]